MDPSHPDPDPVGSPPRPGPDRPVFPEPPLARLAGWWAARAPGSRPGAPPGSGPPGETADEAEAGGSFPGPAPWPPRWRPSVATTVVVLAVAAAGWWLVRPAPAPVEAVLPAASGTSAGAPGGSPPVTADPDGAPGRSPAPAGGAAGGTGADPTPTPVPPPVVVQAAGAVHHPGVHRLPAGSRVDDLVRAAGGATAEADLDRVNLAAPLVDGERVWVPRRGEAEVPPVVSGGGGPAPGAGAASGAGGATGTGGAPAAPGTPVDLNAATAADLDALPGIGPATAAAILAHRDENGPFRSVEDLLDVRGIGEAKLEQLRPLVTV